MRSVLLSLEGAWGFTHDRLTSGGDERDAEEEKLKVLSMRGNVRKWALV